jgi:hypothetical protein
MSIAASLRFMRRLNASWADAGDIIISLATDLRTGERWRSSHTCQGGG